ncbi:hypothetical protein PG984_005251 [Apiospora sp. TS-2023a]
MSRFLNFFKRPASLGPPPKLSRAQIASDYAFSGGLLALVYAPVMWFEEVPSSKQLSKHDPPIDKSAWRDTPHL